MQILLTIDRWSLIIDHHEINDNLKQQYDE